MKNENNEDVITIVDNDGVNTSSNIDCINQSKECKVDNKRQAARSLNQLNCVKAKVVNDELKKKALSKMITELSSDNSLNFENMSIDELTDVIKSLKEKNKFRLTEI